MSERSVQLVVLESRHARIELVDNVKIFAPWVKCQMARAGASLELCKRLFGGNKFARRAVKAIDHYFINAEIRDESMSLEPIEDDAVRVWSFLLFLDAGT